ncbi:hypothetical protein DVH24_038044 [Malus domestica]|uniref:Uncharacterized protein n=1 Tax=Malus domestica TaxID=3750 RepID=A0A498K6E3_MALDO|nr:hypothetical protein DVH24_038044 [Malus domestica]
MRRAEQLGCDLRVYTPKTQHSDHLSPYSSHWYSLSLCISYSFKQRKTKWGSDLTQDASIKKGRALAYQGGQQLYVPFSPTSATVGLNSREVIQKRCKSKTMIYTDGI